MFQFTSALTAKLEPYNSTNGPTLWTEVTEKGDSSSMVRAGHS
jgi:hypothetical protein